MDKKDLYVGMKIGNWEVVEYYKDDELSSDYCQCIHNCGRKESVMLYIPRLSEKTINGCPICDRKREHNRRVAAIRFARKQHDFIDFIVGSSLKGWTIIDNTLRWFTFGVSAGCLCKCSCGNEEIIRIDRIRNANPPKCDKCK